MIRFRTTALLAATAAAIALARPPRAVAQPETARVAVFAAASLAAPFRGIADRFERSHPGTRVDLNFAGSPTLVRQIVEGGRADVFASADEANMQKLVDANAVADRPRVFARNRLTMLVEEGNPKKIASLADLARPGLTIALAAPGVPVGAYARAAFAKAGVPVPPSSEEVDVRAVLQKVVLGEADAGIVYATDAVGGTAVAIPDSQNVIARYPIAVLREAPSRELGLAFVQLALSPEGRQILERAGFLAP
ncbi:MAG TPA: molybdate ABC transporter substrate-binding protein [Candidatus Binatia bacterium]|nr:molybdate ABC transporter substrate-binding protein [Candidatus Binatia bacterium]